MKNSGWCMCGLGAINEARAAPIVQCAAFCVRVRVPGAEISGSFLTSTLKLLLNFFS
jgi:hypothetical protein